MIRRDKRNKQLSILVSVIFCMLSLVFLFSSNSYVVANGEYGVIFTANGKELEITDGIYCSNEDIQVHFTDTALLRYRVHDDNWGDWLEYEDPFLLPSEQNTTKTYLLEFGKEIDGELQNIQQKKLIIDKEKPTLNITFRSGGKMVNGVYTGQNLTFRLSRKDTGVGFSPDSSIKWRAFSAENDLLYDWSDLQEYGNEYTLTINDNKITKLEFACSDKLGNRATYIAYVSIPQGQPVIAEVMVINDRWVDGNSTTRKLVEIHVKNSPVAVNNYMVLDMDNRLVKDWLTEPIADFSGSSHVIILEQGKYKIIVRNQEGLISDAVSVVVDKFDYHAPALAFVDLERSYNNPIYPGRLYFKLQLELGQSGAPLSKIVYKKVGTSEEHTLVIDSNLAENGGNIFVYQDIDAGLWQFNLHSMSGLISNSLILEMKEMSEIEKEWQNLFSKIDIENISILNGDSEAIQAIEDYIENWQVNGNSLELLNNIMIENYNNGADVIAFVRAVYNKKSEFRNNLAVIANEFIWKNSPLSNDSTGSLREYFDDLCCYVNTLPSNLSGRNISDIASYSNEILQEISTNLESKLNSFNQKLAELPRGVIVHFNKTGGVGVEDSKVFDIGECVNVLEYQPVRLGHVFLYWQDDATGERMENDQLLIHSSYLELDNNDRQINLSAVWQVVQIITSERSGQRLENFTDILPSGACWKDSSMAIASAGVYTAQIIINNEERDLIVVVTPVIDKVYHTQNRLMSVSLPKGWVWENGTTYLQNGSQDYYVIFNYNVQLLDGGYHTLYVRERVSVIASNHVTASVKGTDIYLLIGFSLLVISGVLVSVYWIKKHRSNFLENEKNNIK